MGARSLFTVWHWYQDFFHSLTLITCVIFGFWWIAPRRIYRHTLTVIFFSGYFASYLLSATCDGTRLWEREGGGGGLMEVGEAGESQQGRPVCTTQWLYRAPAEGHWPLCHCLLAAACAKAIRGGAPAQKRGGEGRRGELGVRDEGGESVRERGRRKNKRVISEFEGGVDLCSSEPNQSP